MVSNNDVASRLSRLKQGCPPRVLDLFSGAGGISLGFRTAAFEIAGAVEVDPVAAETHSNNFESVCLVADITELDPTHCLYALGPDSASAPVDVLVGGPPCQAFARIGRAKLRHLGQTPTAYLEDSRAELFKYFLKFVATLNPLSVLIENVPDMMNYGSRNIAEEICLHLGKIGYQACYSCMNAAEYGVPQHRERVFILGFSKETGIVPQFPIPTHHTDMPSGYVHARQAALNRAAADTHRNSYAVVDLPFNTKPTPTVTEALGDIPPIDARALIRNRQLKKGRRDLTIPIEYAKDPQCGSYAELMRGWKGYETNGTVTAHVIRYLPRDHNLFAMMVEGEQYPEIHKKAEQLLVVKVRQLLQRAHSESASVELYDAIRKATVPPYDPNKFPNKWWKMESDKPSRTLTAHLGKDSYSHIHFDSKQARTISVREAARLQSFPDGFVFSGGMNSAFRQIGNAVPPLLSYRIASSIATSLGYEPGEIL